MLGPAGVDRFEAMEAAPPAARSAALDASGYYVARSNWSEHADYVCFDCGEQAAGMRTDAVPNSMHGHADCLSVIAWLDGHRVLVDAGLFAYNCGGPWEAHFRETAAHNTARVDGRNQALHIGKMAWSHSYRATREAWMTDDVQTFAVGSHDGFARGPYPVTHRRGVWLRPGSYLLICDEFIGIGEHDLEVNYQFAPGELAMSDDGEGAALFDAAVETVWSGSIPWTARLRTGGPGPDDGWIAGSLGMRQPAPRLSLRGRTADPTTSLLTILAVRQGARPRVSRMSNGAAAADGVIFSVSGDDYVDWIAASGITGKGAIETDALIGVCRTRAGAAVETTRIGGTFLRADAAALGRLCEVASHANGVVR
jgi:hypothetical protein